MKKYFNLHFNDFDDRGEVARLIDLSDQKYLTIKLFDSNVTRFKIEGNDLMDYQSNILGFPLVSKKMKVLIDPFVLNLPFEWKLVLLETHTGTLDYYLPNFFAELDVLDFEKTKFIDGSLGKMIVKACISMKKVRELDFFPIPGSDVRWVVSSTLRELFLKQQVSGLDFTPSTISQ